MAIPPDFIDANSQRVWHAQWPRWVNTLLAYHYVTDGLAQDTDEGRAAMDATLRWLRGMASDDEVRGAMRAAFGVSPVRLMLKGKNGSRLAQLAASVAACAVTRHEDTVLVYATMCITDNQHCAKIAAKVINWIDPLVTAEDQGVAMDRIEELGLMPPSS